MLETQLAPAPTVEDEAESQAPKHAWLASKFGKRELPLEVCKSAAGFYLGTTLEGQPFTRESAQYWPKREQAADALHSPTKWTQRLAL